MMGETIEKTVQELNKVCLRDLENLGRRQALLTAAHDVAQRITERVQETLQQQGYGGSDSGGSKAGKFKL